MLKNFDNAPNHGIYGKEPLNEVEVVKTIKEMLERSFSKYAENVAYLVKDDLKSPYREIKYKEVEKDVYAFATYLISKGFKDKKIAIIGENSYEWEMSYLSVVAGTGTVVPIDKELPPAEIQALLDRAKVSLIICSAKIYAKNQEFFDGLSIEKLCMSDIRECIKEGLALREEGHREFDDAVVNEDDVNIIMFTSGTTGVSKGVMLSHKNIASNLVNMNAMMHIKETDRFFSLLPLHHSYEGTCGFLCPLYRGSSIAFCQGLKYIQKNMQEAQPTLCLAVPLIVESMYDKIMKTIKKEGKEKLIKTAIKVSDALLKVNIDIRDKVFKQVRDALGGKLRIFISGGAPGNTDALKFFRSMGMYAIQGYGLTETAPIVAVNRLSKFDDFAAGLPVPETEVRIDNPNEKGVGEIVVKGDNVMVGYYENEEATKEVLKDGWYYTGDLGYLKDGFIYITGRKKDVIITKNGENVFPESVEKYLNNSPYIKECMVYAEKDEKGNDTVVAALVVPEYDEIYKKFGEGVKEDEVKALIDGEIKTINATMPLAQAVKQFTIRNEALIRTTTQKIKRFANMPQK